nr:DUF397 domain-containing protein [Actinomadura madurae]
MSAPARSAHYCVRGRPGGNEGNCVETADLNDYVGIRDSKAPAAGHLTITRENFTALLTRLAAQP